jgi:hypothetical protein
MNRIPGQLGVLATVVIVANLPLIHRFLLRPHPPVTAAVPFEDHFERNDLGPNYRSIGGQPRILNGAMEIGGVHNNPLWLQVPLPRNVRVNVDARCDSADGDIKLELFGNGWDHESGYLLYFGAWSNTLSVIAKLSENASVDSLRSRERRGDLRIVATTPLHVERRDVKVERGRTYHFRIERTGGMLRWYVDEALFLEMDDPFPLTGPWHDRLGFSSWDSLVYFDNLTIEPL